MSPPRNRQHIISNLRDNAQQLKGKLTNMIILFRKTCCAFKAKLIKPIHNNIIKIIITHYGPISIHTFFKRLSNSLFAPNQILPQDHSCEKPKQIFSK